MLFLITGFDPFGNSALNASREAVRAMPDMWGDHRIVTATLPVVYDKCADALYELLDEHQPDVVLCLGQAVGRDGISLEHAAVNVKASSSPDNAGVTFSGEKIVEDGAESLPSNLPLKELAYALKEVGIPAKIVKREGQRVDELDQIHIPDPVSQELSALRTEIEALCDKVKKLEKKKWRSME